MDQSYVIVTGAFERDNFGDILFGELVAAALAGAPVIRASLISSDMRALGGGLVTSLMDFIAANPDAPPDAIIHVGGEILTCSRVVAMMMDLAPDLAPRAGPVWAAIGPALSDALSDARQALGYVLDLTMLGAWSDRPIWLEAVSAGGVDPIFDQMPAAFTDLAAQAIRSLDRLEVRDATTQAMMKSRLGIDAHLGVDIVFGLRRFCADRIRAAELRAETSLNRPYMVVQANSTLLNDQSLAGISQKIAEIARDLRCSALIQPAGLAAFHDDAEVMSALAVAVAKHGVACRFEPDRDVWGQVARISHAALYIGSSLHGRIIATGAGVPAVSLTGGKPAANGRSWGADMRTFNVAPADMAMAAHTALAVPEDERRAFAAGLEARAVDSLNGLRARVMRQLEGRDLASAPALEARLLAGAGFEAARLRRRLVETSIASSDRDLAIVTQHLEALKSELYLHCEGAILQSRGAPDIAERLRGLEDGLRFVMNRLIGDREVLEKARSELLK